MINNNFLLPSDNIYKYFNFSGNKIGVLGEKGKYSELYINPEKIFNIKYLDWVSRNTTFVEQESNGEIGYFHLLSLENSSLNEWNYQMWRLKRVNNIIIDLRYSVGGAFDAFFIKELLASTYGFITDRYGNRETRPNTYKNKKIVLLVNEYTVSASEIFAYCFKRYKIGKVIGKRTAGECLSVIVKNIDEFSIAIPNKLFLDIDSHPIENKGVVPDLKVENSPRFLYSNCSLDMQLLKAIETLQ